MNMGISHVLLVAVEKVDDPVHRGIEYPTFSTRILPCLL